MSRLTRTLITVGVLLAPATVGTFRVWVHQDVIQMGYQLSVAEKERRQFIADLEELQVEVAAAKSPDRLERMAKDLNLFQPVAGAVYGVSIEEEADHAKE